MSARAPGDWPWTKESPRPCLPHPCDGCGVIHHGRCDKMTALLYCRKVNGATTLGPDCEKEPPF